MRHYFLTGATGSLGLALVPLLLEHDPEAQLHCLVRDPEHSPLRPEALPALFPSTQACEQASRRIHLLRGDILLPRLGLGDDDWRRLGACVERIIHQAASVDFLMSLDEARRLNVDGTRHVAELARSCRARDQPGFRFCHVSTAYVCGQRRGLLREDELDTGIAFWNAYEQTKAESEALARELAAELPVTIVRPSQIVGDSASGQVHKFFGFYEFVGLAVRGRSNVLVADPHARPDMVPVDYVARGMLHLMDSAGAIGQCHHLAAGLQASLRVSEVVDIVMQLMRRMPQLSSRLAEPRVVPAQALEQQLSAQERRDFEFSPQRLLLRSYAPYLDYERDFDVGATHRLLSAAGLALPDMARTIERTTRYALARRHKQAPSPLAQAHPPKEIT